MCAAEVVTASGPADVVVRDIAEPSPSPGEVLIDVHAVGLSFPDVLLSKGSYQLRPEPPFTLGTDVAGVIAGWGTASPGSRSGGASPGSCRTVRPPS